jgi:class 3 adenylate cyclase
VASAAGPDQIFVSRDALDAAGTAFDVHDRRVLELKGLVDPVEICSINWQG